MEPKLPGARCDECPLKDKPLVPAFGPTDAKIAIVGEAPGEHEVRIGRPFVGKSGQLLRRVLEANGIDVDEVYFTNTCMCRPDDNKTPTAKAVAACRNRLRVELQSVHPTFILAFGSVAGKATTSSNQPITKLRVSGSVESPDVDGATVIPTFHPAFALRSPDKLPSIQADLERGLNHSVQVKWEPTRFVVYDDIGSATAALRELVQYPQLAIDVEVCSKDGESHGRPDDFRFLCIGISHKPGAAAVFPDRVLSHEATRRALSGVLQQKGIYHNGKFDIQYLRTITPDVRLSEDTMLLHYMCDERRGTHDLQQIAVNTIGAPSWKTDSKADLEENQRSLAYLPRDILYRYNAQDVDITHRLVEPLTAYMRRENTEKPYRELMIPGASVIADMEYEGVSVDISRLDALQDEFSYILERLDSKFKELGINPRSHPQVKAALHQLGFPVPNTRKDTIEKYNHEFVEEILEYKAKHKVQSVYLAGLRKHIRSGRVHPEYLLHGTETGRLSSKRPNIQNQVREHGIRDIFVPEPGNVFVQADYAAIELRLAGILAGDDYLNQAFRDGRSPHKELAVQIYGPNYTKEQYVFCKSVNFGTLYRESAPHLAHRLKGSVRDAQKMQAAFFERSPAIIRYHKQLEREIHDNGYLTSMFGRKRRFWLITVENAHDVHKEGYNFPLQSAASDITLTALINLHRRLSGVARPRITVHDSLVFECAREHTDYVISVMKQEMETEINSVPITVEFAVGTAWDSLEVYDA